MIRSFDLASIFEVPVNSKTDSSSRSPIALVTQTGSGNRDIKDKGSSGPWAQVTVEPHLGSKLVQERREQESEHQKQGRTGTSSAFTPSFPWGSGNGALRADFTGDRRWPRSWHCPSFEHEASRALAGRPSRGTGDSAHSA